MSEGGFKVFRIGDLFTSQTGDVDLQQSDINGLGEFFINSGVQNYGIKGRTDRTAKVFEPNTISIDFFGNAFYRSFRYKMATHNHVFSLNGDVLKNEKVGLYIVAQLSYLKNVFSYSNMGTWPRIKAQTISLPVDRQGKVNFKYIESYVDLITKREENKLKEFLVNNGYFDCTLTVDEQQALNSLKNGKHKMKGIPLDKVFALKGVKQSKCQSEIPTDDNGIPYIVQSMNNNMCSRNVNRQWLIDNNEPPQDGNTIVLGVTLPSVSYQPLEFGASQVITARNQKLNENVGLYLAAVLSKHLARFSYQNKPGIKKYKELKLFLPITENDTIDYNFMETYINALKKQCIARLKASDIFSHKRAIATQSITDYVIVTKGENGYIPIHQNDDVPISDRFIRFLPVYDIAVACGALEDEGVQSLGKSDVEMEGWIDVSGCGFRSNDQMFVVEAKGESMLPKIHPGDLCIFEAYGPMNAGSRDGKIVLAKQSGRDNDYNCQYTIKIYHSEKDPHTGRNVKVELRPLNKDARYSVIDVADAEGEIKVIATLVEVIN